MNRQELIALSVGLVLVFGVAGVAHVTESVSLTERPYESGGEASSEGEGGATDATIPVVQAMRTAQNETNGVAVEARLRQGGNTSGAQRPIQTYEVNVLTGDGRPVAVDVSAENGTVLGTHPVENRTDGWTSLLGGESGNETPRRQLNLSAIRSGPEAVQLARDESGVDRTVTEVQLGSRNGTVVYNIRMVTKAGGRSTMVVATYPDEGGVLSNETETQSGGA